MNTKTLLRFPRIIFESSTSRVRDFCFFSGLFCYQSNSKTCISFGCTSQGDFVAVCGVSMDLPHNQGPPVQRCALQVLLSNVTTESILDKNQSC